MARKSNKSTDVQHHTENTTKYRKNKHLSENWYICPERELNPLYSSQEC